MLLFAILTLSALFLGWWYRRVSSASGSADNKRIIDRAVSRLPTELRPLPDFAESDQPGLPSSLAIIQFTAVILLYIVTRFINLADFPITFFADEAAPTVLAAELAASGFRYEGALLPTYFLNVDKYSLSLTVYLQLLPYLIFGQSVLVARSVSVLAGLIGVLAISLILKQIFRSPYWWSGLAWLLLTPSWFMHSRTALETPVASALFALFILCYLLYLYRSPGYLPLVILSAALTFYAYNPARLIIIGALMFLLLADHKYHWANRGLLRRYWWLVLLCILPYVRFFFRHPFAAADQLLLLNSYWLQDMPIGQKLLQFVREYARGLSPFYWFFPHDQDLIRHTMKGYGHALWIMLPLVVWGLYAAWKERKTSAYRVLIFALLSAPLGGALVATVITRSLAVVIPLTLLSAIGFSDLMRRYAGTQRLRNWLSVGLVIVTAALSAIMLTDAVRNGPTWYSDYGLYGMQYGSPQVLREVDTLLDNSPEDVVIVSPYWANGTSVLARFFVDDLERLRWGVINEWLDSEYPVKANQVFVMLPGEFEIASTSAAVADLEVIDVIHYPDSEPGFYFARVKLVNANQTR